MTELTYLLSTFGNPWLVLGLLALAVVLLDIERWWTRARRRRGRRVGAPAYALDALAIASAVLATASAAALLARGIIAVALLTGELLGWIGTQARAYSGMLVAIIACIALVAVGVALARSRLRRPRAHPDLSEQPPVTTSTVESSRADVAIVLPTVPQALDQPPGGTTQMAPLIVAPSLAQANAVPTASSPRIITAQADEPTEPLTSLSMLGHNRRPYRSTAPQPQSFLTSAPEPDKRRSRLPLALATLALIGLSVYGFVFRQQVVGLLPALRPATSEVTAAALSLPTSIPAAPTAPLVSRHVKSDTLNLRARPGTDQQVIAKLTHGATVLLLDETATVDGRTWVRVRAGEQEGWVSQDLLE